MSEVKDVVEVVEALKLQVRQADGGDRVFWPPLSLHCGLVRAGRAAQR
jgi:hypothetical protein